MSIGFTTYLLKLFSFCGAANYTVVEYERDDRGMSGREAWPGNQSQDWNMVINILFQNKARSKLCRQVFNLGLD